MLLTLSTTGVGEGWRTWEFSVGLLGRRIHRGSVSDKCDLGVLLLCQFSNLESRDSVSYCNDFYL